MVKIGINGYNEVARTVLRMCAESNKEVKVVHINHENAETQYMAYQLRYSTVYGRFPGRICEDGDNLVVGNTKINVTDKGEECSWEDCDVVIDCENNGKVPRADKTVLSGVSSAGTTVDFGVNHHKFKNEKIVSQIGPCASAIAVMGAVINRCFGLKNAIAVTLKPSDENSRLADSVDSKRWRNGRSAESVIPEVCGGAQSAGIIFPELAGLVSGIVLRTPVRAVSTLSFVCNLKRDADYREISDKIKQASENDFGGLLGVTDESPVSCDFTGCALSVVADLRAGLLQGGNLLKITGWYDGIWSHSAKLLNLAQFMGS